LSKLFANRAWLVTFFFAVALLSLSCEPAEPVANVESDSKKVAVFEGGEVTLGEVQEFAVQSGLGELSPGSPQYEAAIQQIMPTLVEFEIAKAYAEEQGITVSEKEVNQEIETIKDQISQQAQAQGMDVGREEAFQQALQQAGLTEEELRAQLRDQLPIQEVQERVAGDAGPSQEEVEKFYDENKELEFTAPEERCARHILFNKDQRGQAEEVKTQLQEGADFAELAKEFSQDPGSAEQGGDLGCNPEVDPTTGQPFYVQEFSDAVFNSEEGEIVGPLETEFGYHLIEVTDIRPQSTQPLEEVEAQIREQLSTDIQAQEFSAWIQKQKEQRDVKYLPGYKPPT
jgi:peptidyl-prolyl cis-trans isomerase C